MKEKASHLIICVGTLAGLVAVRLKQTWQKSAEFWNHVRFLVIDTAYDDVAFDVLEERERLALHGLPVSEIKANPAAYPAFSQIVIDQMEDVGQLAAGAMRPTTTYAALIWKYPELESKILVALQELGSLPSEGPAAIWVLGSAASTTGRGTWLPTLFAARRVVKKQGGFHPIYGVAIDSDGLAGSTAVASAPSRNVLSRTGACRPQFASSSDSTALRHPMDIRPPCGLCFPLLRSDARREPAFGGGVDCQRVGLVHHDTA